MDEILTIDEKEAILTTTSQIVEQVNNKLVLGKQYKPNLKVYVVGNTINRPPTLDTFISAEHINSRSHRYIDDDIELKYNPEQYDVDDKQYYHQRPSCTIDVDEGEIIFTDIHETAKYLIQLMSDGVNTTACDFHWQGYESAHATACYIDFLSKEYNYFDINRDFNFKNYRERGFKKKIQLMCSRRCIGGGISTGCRKFVHRRKEINFSHYETIKPMRLWIQAIIAEIYILTNIKIKPSKHSFYKKNKYGYGTRMDLPEIHDCPEGMKDGACTFYCRWIDILMQEMSFEDALHYIISLSSDQRKKYIKTLFDKTWDLYSSLRHED